MLPVSLHIISSGSNVGDAIRSGDKLVLKVIQQLAGGKWQVSHDGKLLVVQSRIRLEPGQLVQTRAEISGNKILLHLMR